MISKAKTTFLKSTTPTTATTEKYLNIIYLFFSDFWKEL